ncbi:MAG: hypothetical protein UT13_C0001G0810 [Candidatus Pacebacteria bacterium GW2011_GWF2_38_9]|nr:MAG: Uncharacterized protein US01_C0001G0846 [candidate division TM6 bacterium GW2011_GWF2_28_16]KKQ07825.1 MAG: hypothetical protein US20_C0028G0004 [Candidatus Pacebacteria bacterium GW2011_GWF1_36_5]KKQ89162.1 MAG: hypothetical protein UT13_C0001G0810 [Candidatus Pacebacteria bacterium GW2011_GWF2_38_9]
MLNEKYKQYLLAFFIVFILFFLQFLKLLNLSLLNNAANSWKEKNYILLQKVAHPFKRLLMMWQLTSKLEDLQYRYSEIAAVAVQTNALQKENQELRKILENSDRSYKEVIIAAPVISFAQSFVAAGSRDGVRPKSVVLYKDTLLGLIDQVEERQSSVMLLSQMTDSAILAETNTGLKGVVKGNGREVFLSEIASDAQLEVGQLVFTSSQFGLEKGLLIGKVVRVLADNQALATKTALIEQMANFYEVSLVEIK